MGGGESGTKLVDTYAAGNVRTRIQHQSNGVQTLGGGVQQVISYLSTKKMKRCDKKM